MHNLFDKDFFEISIYIYFVKFLKRICLIHILWTGLKYHNWLPLERTYDFGFFKLFKIKKTSNSRWVNKVLLCNHINNHP